MKAILPYLKKRRWLIAAVMLVKLIGTLGELLLPSVLEYLIDTVAPTRQRGLVFLWGGAMIALAVFVRAVNVTANRLSVRVARESTFEIRRDLFHASLNLSGGQMDAFGLPSITSRMTSDSYNVQSFIQASQTIGIRAPFMLMGGILITLLMDRGLAAILCVMAPVLIALVIGISMRGIPLYDKVQQGLDDMVRVMRENITGIRVVKALSKEDYEMRRFRAVNETAAARDICASIVMALPGPIVTLFLNVGLTLVVVFGARRVNAGVTQPGVILAFLTYFNMIMMGVMGLNRIFMMMSKANASAMRIAAVIDAPEALPPIPEAEAAHTDREGFLVFDHVSFNYDGDAGQGGQGADDTARFAGSSRQKALDDIDFAVKKGGSLGIIGATGSGKTTIINLLMRFYDVDEGRILLDGHDVRDLTRASLRGAYAMVLQDTWVFQGTIFDNIAYGKENATLEEVVAAAKAAHIHPFIMRLPEGYQTVISEDGGNISKGQKQLLTIARAMLYNTHMLILDEATSNVDTSTEREIQRAMRSLMENKTCFVIAHRLSTIQNADLILVLNHGDVVEQGTHESLMRSKGFYYQLYSAQFQ